MSRDDGKYMLHISSVGPVAGVDSAAQVELDPEDRGEPSAWVEALSASGLTPADMRTRVLVHADPDDAVGSVLMLCAVAGFAGRMPDVALGPSLMRSAALYRSMAAFRDEGEPDVKPPSAVSGDIVAEGSVLVPTEGPFPPSLVSEVRYASCSVLARDGRSAPDLLSAFVVLAALREQARKPRFPVLAASVPDRDEEGFLLSEGDVDLEALRRAASNARRSARSDVRTALAEPVGPSAAASRMLAAASVPLPVVLLALGSEDMGGFWRCPRPSRHRNGDANPSAELTEEGFMCHRCDLEPVDPVRLVMDCRGCSPCEASDWLSSLEA